MKVVMIGARDRSSLKETFDQLELKDGKVEKELIEQVLKKDNELVKRIIDKLKDKFRGSLKVLSVGCDDGIGYIVKSQCVKEIIGFAEVSIHFGGPRMAKPEYARYYLARNATVMELGEVFILFTNSGRQSVMDDLIERIKNPQGQPPPYVIFNEYGGIEESNTAMLDDVASQRVTNGK